MRVLVTGGAGYIGSVVTEVLLTEGHEAVVIDDLSKGHADAVPEGVPLVRANIGERGLVRRMLDDERIDAVMHFAASSLVGESMARPSDYYRNNLVNGLTLLDGLIEAGPRPFVFSSTAAVYGEPERQPITEDDATRPTNTYGETKLAFEHALEWYSRAHGLPFASLRYFNAAGASDARGERHDPETHLIPLVLAAAAGTSPPVTIFGRDYPTRDGTCVRDYVHVLDLAQAHVRVLEALADGSMTSDARHIYNLGCGGEGYTVKEVIDTAAAIVGRPIPTIEGDRRAGDPAVLVASSDRMQEDLGWRPRFNELGAIVESAWRFMEAGCAGRRWRR